MKTRCKLLEEAIKAQEVAKIKQIRLQIEEDEITATMRTLILLGVLASLVWLASL